MTLRRKYSSAFCMTALLVFAPGLSLAEQSQTVEQPDSDNSAQINALASHLAAEPEDTAARARLARKLGQAGRYEEALAEYDSLIRVFPGDVDHALGRGQVLSWLGRDREAVDELERARKLAPDYEAVWQLQFSLLRRQQGPDSAKALEALGAEAENRFPDARWWRRQESVDETRWQLTVGAGYERLSRDLPNWNNQFMQLDWIKNTNERYFGRLARDVRFDTADQQLAAGGEWRLLKDWAVGAELNTSPAADFQPKTGFALHAGRTLGKAWVADVSVRQRRFSNATVTTYGPTLQHYFGNYRAAYGLNVSHLQGLGNSVAHTLALDWYITAKNSVRLTLANGDEAEAVGTGQVLETSVSSVTLSGRHAFTERLALSWWTGTHRQGDLYRRSYAGLAITVGL